ncbi:unnamed protein product, partial [marine sediment metagenome]
MNATINVLVIVDSIITKRGRYIHGRHSFWASLSKELPDVQIQQISIPESHDQKTYINFDPFKWQVVVFNWDVVDGDSTFRSNETQNIINYHYTEQLKEFVSKGGIVLIEAQTSYWAPDQSAYDILLGKNQVKCREEKKFAIWGTDVLINEAYKDHPLLQGLPNRISSKYPNELKISWFPEGSVNDKVVDFTHPNKIFCGSFSKWRKRWVPIIKNDQNEPTMLIANQNEGFIIVTTMFLASSRCISLLKNLLRHTSISRYKIKSFHKKIKRIRLFWLCIAILIISLVFFFGLFILEPYISYSSLPL